MKKIKRQATLNELKTLLDVANDPNPSMEAVETCLCEIVGVVEHNQAVNAFIKAHSRRYVEYHLSLKQDETV